MESFLNLARQYLETFGHFIILSYSFFAKKYANIGMGIGMVTKTMKFRIKWTVFLDAFNI